MKKTIVYSLSFLSMMLIFAFATVQTNWTIKDNYSIKFSSKDANGIFKTFSGTVVFDAAQLDKSKFDLTLDVASISTGNAMQNKHAKNAEWFDAEKYPKIKFISSKIEKTDNGFKAIGSLEIRGIKKDFSVPFTFKNKIFSATFNVNRTDFKVGKADGEVSNVIKIDAAIPVK